MTRLGNPESIWTMYPLTLTLDQLTLTFDFALTFDQTSKFPKDPILLSFSRRFRFWTPFLYFETLKSINWHILHCGFFKGILQGISKWSSHAYPTSSLHSASTLSLREGVRDILNILAQCNRPKPSLGCTSSLGFSSLYILMLWLIVTRIIKLHFYTQ